MVKSGGTCDRVGVQAFLAYLSWVSSRNVLPSAYHAQSTCLCGWAVLFLLDARQQYSRSGKRRLASSAPSLLVIPARCCPPHLQAALTARLSAVQPPALVVTRAARPTTRLVKCAARLASATTSAAHPVTSLAHCAAIRALVTISAVSCKDPASRLARCAAMRASTKQTRYVTCCTPRGCAT